MIAMDTNVLVRFLVDDDPAQADIANELMKHQGGIFISKTVLLELEWVLRRVYNIEAKVIRAGLNGLFGMPNVTVESVSQVSQAMLDFAQGMDFADALHAASSQAEEGFYTFDKKFAKKAVSLGRNVNLAQAGGASQSR